MNTKNRMIAGLDLAQMKNLRSWSYLSASVNVLGSLLTNNGLSCYTPPVSANKVKNEEGESLEVPIAHVTNFGMSSPSGLMSAEPGSRVRATISNGIVHLALLLNFKETTVTMDFEVPMEGMMVPLNIAAKGKDGEGLPLISFTDPKVVADEYMGQDAAADAIIFVLAGLQRSYQQLMMAPPSGTTYGVNHKYAAPAAPGQPTINAWSIAVAQALGQTLQVMAAKGFSHTGFIAAMGALFTEVDVAPTPELQQLYMSGFLGKDKVGNVGGYVRYKREGEVHYYYCDLSVHYWSGDESMSDEDSAMGGLKLLIAVDATGARLPFMLFERYAHDPYSPRAVMLNLRPEDRVLVPNISDPDPLRDFYSSEIERQNYIASQMPRTRPMMAGGRFGPAHPWDQPQGGTVWGMPKSYDAVAAMPPMFHKSVTTTGLLTLEWVGQAAEVVALICKALQEAGDSLPFASRQVQGVDDLSVALNDHVIEIVRLKEERKNQLNPPAYGANPGPSSGMRW